MSKKKKGNRKRREPALAPTLEALKARAEGILVHMDRREIILGQMDTAIWLWFNDKDIVSIQVLAGSAHQNLDALGSGIGKGPTLKNDLGWDRLYFAYDVFRHASANPNESFDFALVSNEVLLTDATVSFESIFGHRTPWMNTFAAFMMLPTIFKKSTDGLFFEDVRLDEVRDLSRQAFAAKMFPIYVRLFHSDGAS